MNKDELESYKKAGKIAIEVRDYAKKLIKEGMKLVDIAEKIEAKIKQSGAEPAFPVNLCINDIAAHYTPTLNDETKASGLLKVDIGVHIDGFIADTAIAIDLTKDKQHKEMIVANEKALADAIKIIGKETAQNEIGTAIHKSITDAGFSPVRNLSGHSLGEYTVHSGITIRNYDDGNDGLLPEGAYAIEPFATTGQGVVYEGAPSSIYHIVKDEGKPRDSFAREVLAWIQEHKQTLPFSERELEREFKRSVKIALKRLEEADIIKSYPQLIEKSHKPVTQAEHTIIIKDNGKVEVTTD